MIKKGQIFTGIIVAIVLVCVFLSSQLVEEVKAGQYHVIQRPVTGQMQAINKPGMYMQFFSTIMPWNNMETFYFIADADEGTSRDQSIEVRFNDGSVANISGTMRVQLPTSGQQQIALVENYAFRDYDALESKFILPIVRNAARRTANLMTARESYSEKRSLFNDLTWDQIQNGLYLLEEVTITEEVETGLDEEGKAVVQEVSRKINQIKRGEDGLPLREKNPLEDTGISLANFEIKQFVYKGKVNEQIAEQQENLMAIATAKAQRQRAEEEERRVVAEGKKAVAEAKYQKEQEKIRAVVDAQKEKEVAELQAHKQLEVAKLDAKAADEEKTANIRRGEGEAKRKALVMQADGALKQKLEAQIQINKLWAEAFANRKVPATYIAGGGDGAGSDPDMQFKTFMQLQNLDAITNLNLKAGVK